MGLGHLKLKNARQCNMELLCVQDNTPVARARDEGTEATWRPWRPSTWNRNMVSNSYSLQEQSVGHGGQAHGTKNRNRVSDSYRYCLLHMYHTVLSFLKLFGYMAL